MRQPFEEPARATARCVLSEAGIFDAARICRRHREIMLFARIA
jgi:hypothetical protein